MTIEKIEAAVPSIKIDDAVTPVKTEANSVGQGVEKEEKELWTEETFDSEKAHRLVTNLRGDVSRWKQKAHDFEAELGELSSKVEQLNEQLAEKEREINRNESVRVKEKLLSERGLPLNLIDALNGDDRDGWEQMADMLEALRKGSDASQVAPDPVQSESAKSLSGDSARMALAKQIFGN